MISFRESTTITALPLCGILMYIGVTNDSGWRVAAAFVLTYLFSYDACRMIRGAR